MTVNVHRRTLEKLYRRYNRREFVHPDPIEFLYAFSDVRDREIAALIASSLAYGRVRQILKSVSAVLDKMQPSPSVYLKRTTDRGIKSAFKGFKHRFTTGHDISCLLVGTRSVIEDHGSLERCFLTGLRDEHDTVIPALTVFVKELCGGSMLRSNDKVCLGLVPPPEKKSACKRLNLFLRWMVRKDEVDPGGWKKVPASKLIVPLDTHMHRIARELGLTKRKQANLKTAIEITSAFAKIAPEDPVKYDFTLTRFGIRNDLGKLPPLCKGRVRVG